MKARKQNNIMVWMMLGFAVQVTVDLRMHEVGVDENTQTKQHHDHDDTWRCNTNLCQPAHSHVHTHSTDGVAVGEMHIQ
jgi:hypothetical protein